MSGVSTSDNTRLHRWRIGSPSQLASPHLSVARCDPHVRRTADSSMAGLMCAPTRETSPPSRQDDRMSAPEVLWSPPADVLERSRIGDFLRWLERTRGLTFRTYDEVWHWSVTDLPGFWGAVWEYFDVQSDVAP